MPRVEVPQPSPERVAEARRRLQAIWTDADYSQPAIVVGFPGQPGEPSYAHDAADVVRDPEVDLQAGLAIYRRDVAALEAGFDNCPGHRTFLATVAFVPSAFGCPVGFENRYPVLCRHIADRPEQVWGLEPADVRRAGLTRVGLEHLEYILEATGGRMLRQHLAVQSPMGVATQVYHYQDFLVLMRTHPEAAHRLLDLATRAIVDAMDAQAELLSGQPYGWIEFWRTSGIHLADDVVAVVSTATYDEFFRPYNERLARRYGGFRLHCCLGYQQNLAAVAQTWGFLAFDPAPTHNAVELILDAVVRNRAGVWVLAAADRATAVWAVRAARRRVGLVLSLGGKSREQAFSLGHEIRRLAEDEAHRPALDLAEIIRTRPPEIKPAQPVAAAE